MYKVVKKEKIAQDIFSLKIYAPSLAKKAKAGQFLTLRLDGFSEKIPFSIADNTKTTITLIFKTKGYSTVKLSKLRKNSYINEICGPLGNPTEIDMFGDVAVILGGSRATAGYSIVKSLQEAGNNVTTIIGAKSKKHFFWLDKFEKYSNKMIYATVDGSMGEKGLITELIRKLLRKKHFNRVITIGPAEMMKAVSDITRTRVKTIASLNPIIVDGIGMCGSCRVKVGEKTMFACVDGPEFDAHQIKWLEFIRRLSHLQKEEKHLCRIRK